MWLEPSVVGVECGWSRVWLESSVVESSVVGV